MSLSIKNDPFNCGHITIGHPLRQNDNSYDETILNELLERLKNEEITLISGTFLEKEQAWFIEILKKKGFKRTTYFESRYSNDNPQAIYWKAYRPSVKFYGKKKETKK